MASVNRVTLLGNLARDPESRSTQDGRKIVTMTVATSQSWKDADGQKREKAEFHRVVIFNEGLGGVAEKYLRKGSKVYLAGQLQNRKWTDEHGNERYATEVVMSNFGAELVLLSTAGEQAEKPQAVAGDTLADEIPF